MLISLPYRTVPYLLPGARSRLCPASTRMTTSGECLVWLLLLPPPLTHTNRRQRGHQSPPGCPKEEEEGEEEEGGVE